MNGPLLDTTSFQTLRTMIRGTLGISLNEQKSEHLRLRLGKRLYELGLTDFKSYVARLQDAAHAEEWGALADLVTTNKTSFFRDAEHFNRLASLFRGDWLVTMRRAYPELRLWSAASSSGEEAFSLSAVAHTHLQGRIPYRVLGTDISLRVLKAAREAQYAAESMTGIPLEYRNLFAVDRNVMQPKAAIREPVAFRRLNLASAPYPFRHMFHVIFCCNVLIYFDSEGQRAMIEAMADTLAPGGYLFLGQSESSCGQVASLRRVGPSIFEKC